MTPDPTPADYGLRPLLDLAARPLVAPPAFDALVGYAGDRRHVAFAWGVGDTIEYADGRVFGTGYGRPWLYWSRHLSMAASLTGVDIGSCDSPPVHRVVLDRFTSRLSFGAADDVGRFLADAPDLRAERQAWEALSDDEQRAVQERAGEAFRGLAKDVFDLNTWDEFAPERVVQRVHDAMRFDRAAAPRLVEWLDARPVRCPTCAEESAARRFQEVEPASCPVCRSPFHSQALMDRIVEVQKIQRRDERA